MCCLRRRERRLDRGRRYIRVCRGRRRKCQILWSRSLDRSSSSAVVFPVIAGNAPAEEEKQMRGRPRSALVKAKQAFNLYSTDGARSNWGSRTGRIG